MQVDPFVNEIKPTPVEHFESGGFFDYPTVTTFVSERPWETGCVIALSVACTVQVNISYIVILGVFQLML